MTAYSLGAGLMLLYLIYTKRDNAGSWIAFVFFLALDIYLWTQQ